ncbi:MAG: amidohydrolase family protein [Deltaproteobacteria bacterium]|nr:amidohydrolase family protein [Deltaproteobacteria bacterium]
MHGFWSRFRCLRRPGVLVVVVAASAQPYLPAAGLVHAQTGPPALVLHHPEIVLVNGKVVTVDDRFSIREAVAIRDGKFLAVGTSAEIRALAGPNTRVIDLKGRTVLPGLIDSHIHFLRSGFRWKWEVRVDEAQSLSDIFQAIKARAQQVPPGTWILVLGGWHWSQVKERRMPTRAELDAVAPNHPVHVQALYEVAQMNTAAIKASGITAATPIPQGAILERDARGNFTGVVRGFAGMRFAETRFPKPTLEDKVEGLRLVMRDFNAAGLTGVVEGVGGGVTDDDYQALFEVWRLKQLTLRVGMHFHANDHEHALRWIRHLPAGFGDDMLRLNGLGEIVMWPLWDGSLPASFPIARETKAAFQRVVEAAAEKKVTVAMALANVIVNFHPRKNVVPYLLAGIGVGQMKLEAIGLSSRETANAYQIAGGSRFFFGGHQRPHETGLGPPGRRHPDGEDRIPERPSAGRGDRRPDRGRLPPLHVSVVVHLGQELAGGGGAAHPEAHPRGGPARLHPECGLVHLRGGPEGGHHPRLPGRPHRGGQGLPQRARGRDPLHPPGDDRGGGPGGVRGEPLTGKGRVGGLGWRTSPC